MSHEHSIERRASKANELSHPSSKSHSPSPPPQDLMVDPLIDRHDIFYLLKRNWAVLVFIPLVCAIIGALVRQSEEPLYESSALLLVDSSLDKLLQFEQVGGGANAIQESLKSLEVAVVADSVVLRVIEKLNLREEPGFLPPEMANAPELPDAKLLNFLRKNRITAALQPQTRLIRISVVDPEPERARLIAATFVEEFEAFLSDQRKQEVAKVRETIESQAETARNKAVEAEALLRQFREANKGLPVEQDHDLFSVRLSKFGTDLNAAIEMRVEIESLVESVSDLDPESNALEIIEIGGYRDVNHVSSSLTALADSKSLLASAQQQYTESHPLFQSANAAVERNGKQVQEIARDIKSSLQARLRAAKEKEKHIQSELAQLQDQFVELKTKSAEFRALQEDAESQWMLYKSLQDRISQNVMATEMPGRLATVVSEPLTPYGEAGIPVVIYAAIGGVFGCFVAFCWLIFRLLSGLPFQNSRQLEERLGLPVIADWTKIKEKTREFGSTARLNQFLKNSHTQAIQISAPSVNGTAEEIARKVARFTAESGLKTLFIQVKPGATNPPEIVESHMAGLHLLTLTPGDVIDETRLPSAMARIRREFDKIIIEAGSSEDPTLVGLISRFFDQDVVVVGKGSVLKSHVSDFIRHLCPAGPLPVGLILVNEEPASNGKSKRTLSIGKHLSKTNASVADPAAA